MKKTEKEVVDKSINKEEPTKKKKAKEKDVKVEEKKVCYDFPNFFQNKKYFLRTYGCQMNVHDSEEIKAILENLGFTETKVLEESNIVVLNTCAIRENARDKVVGFLGKCK